MTRLKSNAVIHSYDDGASYVTVEDALNSTDAASLSVITFGATGDGSTDDTAAIEAAISAADAAATDGVVYFPAGTYKVSSALTIPNGVAVRGDSRTVSIIETNSATANILDVTGTGSGVYDLGFSSSVIRTGGRYLNLTGQFAVVDRVRINGAFVGIYTSANARINEVHITNTVPSTGVSVQVEAPNQEVVIRSILIDNPNASQSLYGLQVLEVGDLMLSDFDILHSGIGMIINPDDGNTTAIFASNGFLDSNTSHGLLIGPSGTGVVQECHFHGVWSATSASGNGFVTATSGSGAVRNISFVDCMGVNNASGQGIAIGAGENLNIIGGLFAANINGIHIAANITDFSVIGVTSGDYGRFSGNSAYGINILAGTSDRYVVANNRLNGNTSGALTDGGSGTDKIIFGNPPASTPTLAAANFVLNGAAAGAMTVQFLRRIVGVNFNSANSDNAITITLPTGFTRYRIGGIMISGASASLTTATFGVFTAVAGGGTAIIAGGTAITVSTASESTNNNFQLATPTTVNTASWNNATIYFRVGTAQGSAATADVSVFVQPVS